MINLNDPLVQLKITSGTCSFFALGSTLYRLYHRRGRFGVDDFWALVAFIALIIQVVAVFLHFPAPSNLSQTTRAAVFYLSATTFYVIIWASRLSILFSLIRIDPTSETRRRLFWVAAAFVVVSLVLLAQLFWVCEGTFDSWKDEPHPGCELPLQVAVFQLITAIIADCILLFTPLLLFRDLLDKALRQKLGIIFSTCIVTTIVSLVHAALILQKGEDCLSLIVANLPVVVTAMVDIAAETDQPGTSQTSPFSTFWSGGWITTRQVTEGAAAAVDSPAHLVGDEGGDNMELPYIKTTGTNILWNENDLPESEQAGHSLEELEGKHPLYVDFIS
ncbi:hypothetical protein C8F04DRAFT_1399343 [Mycena alexandri]|uniref:Rhodopsin domain-containing protein n=1 Tax=Mycena alexandri TaxID=1745969 RepID=A0AAD6WY95_9AGAR|nr:hypothetical protein C8F04DRAFT_1399343 [Mycena alexandri]